MVLLVLFFLESSPAESSFSAYNLLYYKVLSNTGSIMSPNILYALPFSSLLLNPLEYNFNNALMDSTLIPSENIDEENNDSLQIKKEPGPYGRMNIESPEDIRRRKMLTDSLKNLYQMDSTGNRFTIKDEFLGQEANYPYEMSLDDYLKIRKENIRRGIWDSLITHYDLKQALSGGDLARMLAQATGLSIPVPPNPVTSIFGKPEISINVSGEVNLRLGWRWDTQNLGTVSAFGQSQSSPIFDQNIKLNVSAKVGDKVKLGTDWNTRRQFEHENKFKIGYEGDDDEIIKRIEVGNVELPVPSTLIGGGQALFGVRADFQFGPLFLKTIASQRRGERKYVNVTGGSSKQPFYLRAYDYSKNHFFIDTAYKDIWKEYFKKSTPVIPKSGAYYRINQIEVWESTNQVTDINARDAKAFDTLAYLKRGEKYPPQKKYTDLSAGQVEAGRFMPLDSTRYKIDRNLGHLTILNLRPDRYYAVAYVIQGDESGSRYCGELKVDSDQKDTLILKLIYRPNMQPGFTYLWKRWMKNIYSIQATGVNTQDTKINVWYINQNNDSSDVLPGAPDKLVTVLRVDQVNNSTGAPNPDGQFDLQPPFFNPLLGEITFPSLEPFREGLQEYFSNPDRGTPQLADQFIFNEVYDTTYDIAKRNTARDRFVIAGEVSGRATNRIALGAFNLAPNSVRVTLDGVPLKEYEDYVVDYYSGMLTLRNPRATLPNANLKIEYEANDIFNISTRTLLGMRADYELQRSRFLTSTIGLTAMHYDQSVITDRVRLGEEPVSNTMIGLDGNLKWDTQWMTKLLSKLPFYDTKAKSSISARGEWAMILPNPNKRNSEVTEDNNEPVVYIDDFEGAQRNISLGLSPSQWQHSSQPKDATIPFEADSLAKLRGKLFWYQYFIPRTPLQEPWPKKETIQGNRKFSPLHIFFNPDERGIYNKNPEFVDDKNPQYNEQQAQNFQSENRPNIWGGMQRLLSAFNTNFDTENIEYIEVMMKIDQWDPGKTKMYIDLGYISEDIIPNKILNTEDGSTPANPLPNNIIDVGEDTGIDTLSDAREKQVYPYPLNLENDPAHDDYTFDFNKDDRIRNENDFINYNNFEGNASVSEIGQFPDTEILNKNNGQTIFLNDSYFTYEVNLQPDPNVNTQIIGGANNWYIYRIPVRRPIRKTGNPAFSNIQYVRVWFKGGILKASIADWRLVGSHWERLSNIQSNVTPQDSVLQVSFVNVEENSGPPEYYSMPPGVKAPRQINSPDPTRDIRLNEQSIAVSVRNLRYGEERLATRFFRAMDLFYYKKLKFFIHGDGSMPDNIVSGAIPKAYAFIRFGIDSSNYYEYRRPLTRGWQSVNINLEDLTAIKMTRDSSNRFIRQEAPVPGDELARFFIKGSPILTRVQYFAFGISNPREQFPNELTTTMWVDELRLISPERTADWAAVANVDMQLADLGRINANINYKKPNFHRLEERFGDRVTSTNWSVSMQGNLEKFAPESFKQMKIPITYTHSETSQNPEFVANNDINLESAANAAIASARRRADSLGVNFTTQDANAVADAVRVPSQTLRVQDSWALTGVRLGIPIDYWLIRDTFNQLTFNYSYAQDYLRDPIVEERFNWAWRFDLKYVLNITSIATVKPFTWAKDVPILDNYDKLRLNFLPTNVAMGINMTRSRQTEKSRFLPYPSPVIRDFTAVRNLQFTWRFAENGFLNPTLDYSFNTSSTLVPLELDADGNQRTGSEIANQIFFNNGLLNLGTNNQHSQTFNLNFKPRLPLGSYERYFDISGSYGTNYNWTNPMQKDPTIRDVAKTASWDNTIRLNMGISLKSMSDRWFGIKEKRPSPQYIPPDTTKKEMSISSTIARALKFIFLDYEKLDIAFTQNNSSVNPGVYGGTGLTNFWSLRPNDDIYGPSAAYQLGLVTNPHGGFRLAGSNAFPFFKFDTFTGLRPPNAVMQDAFTQRSKLDLKTSRPLWEGATLDLSWNSEIGWNKNMIVETDEFGHPTFSNIIGQLSYNRSYLTFPSIFGLNVFNNDIDHVVSLYKQKKEAILASTTDELERNHKLLLALSESFHDGMQAFSIFGGNIGKFLPQINWQIRWEGIEKWGLWHGIAQRITIDHRYASNYTEMDEITDNGKAVQSQAIQYGFQPLVGVTASFDQRKLEGVLTASLRYSTSSAYQLTSANRATIARQSSDEFTMQASYARENFKFNLLGIDLENEIEFSFMATYKANKRATYDVVVDNQGQSTSNPADGRTLDGSTQILIEPRVRYTMSKRINASFFYRYEGTFNEGAAQPGFSTHQVGLDIRISLAGGR